MPKKQDKQLMCGNPNVILAQMFNKSNLKLEKLRRELKKDLSTHKSTDKQVMMKGVSSGQIRFIFWILITIIFVLYAIYFSFSNELISKIINFFIFIMAALVFTGTFLSFYARFKKVKYYLKIKKEKDRNIRDFYRYERFIDPPDFKLNN